MLFLMIEGWLPEEFGCIPAVKRLVLLPLSVGEDDMYDCCTKRGSRIAHVPDKIVAG